MGPFLLLFIGESDCEAIGSGFLHQPANALSSLAFTLIGLSLIAYRRRLDGGERPFLPVFAWLMIATGIGSFLYHGPQWPGSHFFHDVTFLATVWFLAFVDAALAAGRLARTAWFGFTAGVAVLCVVLVIAPGATNVLTGMVAVALVASDVIVHRTSEVDGRWYAAALGALALALLANWAGRTGSPVCDPNSLAQAHFAWHALAALALAAYFQATVPARRSAIATTR